jgi:uncharacterized coiled-coil DUF342 family protein
MNTKLELSEAIGRMTRERNSLETVIKNLQAERDKLQAQLSDDAQALEVSVVLWAGSCIFCTNLAYSS